MSRKGDAPVRREVQVSSTSRRLSLPARALLAVLTGSAVYAVLAVLPPTSGAAPELAVLLVAVAAVVLAVAALAPRRDDRAPWLLITAGMLTVLVVRVAAQGSLGAAPSTVLTARVFAGAPWAGVLVLVAFGVVLAGVHRLVASSISRVRHGQWVDTALAGLVTVAVLNAALAPHLQGLGLSPLTAAVLTARPVVSVMIAGTALVTVLLRGRDRDPRLEVVLLAGLLFAAGDVLAFLVTTELVQPSPWVPLVVGAARLCTFCLFAVAALGRPTPRAAATPSARGGQLVVVGVLLCAVGLLAAGHVGLERRVPEASVVLAVLALLGAGVRLVHLSGEVAGLQGLRHQLRHDELTGLLNRHGMAAAVADHLDRDGRPAALVLVDLDAFKDVNDRCGTAVGDEVLRVIARRLERLAGRDHLVARLGADEFSLLLPGAGEAEAAAVAARVLEEVQLPIAVADRQVRIAASAGTAAVAAATGAEELLRRADLALHRAKATGGTEAFDEALDAAAKLRERLLEDLRTVIADPGGAAGRVVAHYQPQLDADGTVSGVEALVRWEHPELGLLQPFAFIDLAEEHGLLPGLTEQVLREAVRQTARWRAGGHELRVAVNLSASCLDWPRLLDVVDDVLASRLLPPAALVLEVTETGLVSDAADGLKVAADLVDRGVELSIDDYGTGYSSLAHLNHLPARELKLDRAFTRQLLVDERTATIVRATIDLAHALGMRLVAEGVEDEATLAAVTAIGCDVTQGYWHSRPLPAAELTGWLAQRSARATTA